MDLKYRNLYDQIIGAVTETEGTPLDRPETLVTQVVEIDPSMPGMQAMRGMPVAQGLHPVPIQSGVYLARTIHRRGDQEVSIYNICIMDAAGEIRLLLDIRADGRTPGFAKVLQAPITKLVAEHAELNGAIPPTSQPADADPDLLPPVADYTILSADTQVRRLLRNATVLISRRRPKQWSEWVTLLLKDLREKTDEDHYEAFLEEVSDAIATRIMTGLW